MMGAGGGGGGAMKKGGSPKNWRLEAQEFWS